MAGKAHCMVSFSDPASGAVLTSATVNVYNPGTVTPISATMFDKNGNVLTNPLTADPVTGLVDAYVNVAQETDMVVAKSGYTTRTYSNVPFLDDASNDLTALLTTTGDIPYASGANTPARLPIGTNTAVLNIASGAPAWTGTGAANSALMVNAAANALTWGPGAFTGFTPTVSQNGALTTSSAIGRYMQIGKLIIATVQLTLSQSGTAGSAIIVGGLPVNGQTNQGSPCFGFFQHTGGPFYGLSGIWASATTVQFVASNAGGAAPTGAWGVSPATGLVSGDVIYLTLIYEST